MKHLVRSTENTDELIQVLEKVTHLDSTVKVELKRDLEIVAEEAARKITELFAPQSVGCLGKLLFMKTEPSKISVKTGLLIAEVLGMRTDEYVYQVLLQQGGKKALTFLMTQQRTDRRIAEKAKNKLFTYVLSPSELYILSQHHISCGEAIEQLGTLNYAENTEIIQKTLLHCKTNLHEEEKCKHIRNEMARKILDDQTLSNRRAMIIAIIEKCSGAIVEVALDESAKDADTEKLMEIYNTEIKTDTSTRESIRQKREMIFEKIVSKIDEITVVQGPAWESESGTKTIFQSASAFRVQCVKALPTHDRKKEIAALLLRSHPSTDELYACTCAMPSERETYAILTLRQASAYRDTDILCKLAILLPKTRTGIEAMKAVIECFKRQLTYSPEQTASLESLKMLYPAFLEQIESILPKNVKRTLGDLSELDE